MQVISREALYARVWAEPMIKVAAAFGVSGTALKKTCDRQDIPTPERGYWAKLAHGKRVVQEALPPLKNGASTQVMVRANPARRLASKIRAAGEAARVQAAEAQSPAPAPLGEHRALAATRKALTRAKPDARGFASGSGRGVVPFSIAPANAGRPIAFLDQLFRVVEAQGHRVEVAEQGLILRIDEEPVAVALDEPQQRTPHEPTPKELKLKADRLKWGSTADPWPKYDHSPSGRLALVIRENDYSGLRRSYADRKTKSLEAMLPDVMAGVVEHAALKKERRLQREEEARLAAIREAERRREAAFARREQRRWEFLEAVDAALAEGAKLRRVLAHLEAAPPDEASRLTAMIEWARLRLRACEAKLGPVFLDISARSAEVEFDEAAAAAGPKGADEHRYYGQSPALHLWVIDESRDPATSCSTYAWIRATLEATSPAPTEAVLDSN
jgi:hypothetical protein